MYRLQLLHGTSLQPSYFSPNLGMGRYREAILDGLKAEGHRIILSDVGGDDDLKKAIAKRSPQSGIAATQEALHTSEALAIAAASDITRLEFDKLQEQRAKTQTERHQERKYSLGMRYSVEVTPDLVLKDDDGWYPQLRLLYYATVGRAYLKRRDTRRASTMSEQGNGAVFMPDFNKGQISASVGFLEKLGILELLDGREVSASDSTLQQIAAMARANQWNIKAVLGISISSKDTPIAIAQKLLDKCGLKLSFLGRRGGRGEQQRIYKYVDPIDGRSEVFSAWLDRDGGAVVATPGNKEVISIPGATTPSVATPPNKEVIGMPGVTTKLEFPGANDEDAVVEQMAAPPPIPSGVWVSYRKMGRMLKFTIHRFIDEATAEIKSVLTGEAFQVPVTQLVLWSGAT